MGVDEAIRIGCASVERSIRKDIQPTLW
jgi:hypothetical protein